VHDIIPLLVVLSQVLATQSHIVVQTTASPAPPHTFPASGMQSSTAGESGGQSASVTQPTHVSVESSQVDAPVHGFPACPVHAPASQKSLPLQNMPSLHMPSPAVLAQRLIVGSHAVVVQASPSLQSAITQAVPQHICPRRQAVSRTQSPLSSQVALASHGPGTHVVPSSHASPY
jgi:hypothetical protein